MITQPAADPFRRRQVSLTLVQPAGLLERHPRLMWPAREAQDVGEICERPRAELEILGPGTERVALAPESFCLGEVSCVRQELFAHRAPPDLRIQVLERREAISAPAGRAA